ncbi:hypothetical protein DPMN_172556 [Dreissena polymorpha]|uniref:Uncharacterized protein n=2 Tax=Dreissena polymorpha TaxID=45954 RepID=A0A9D4IER7_DREPO|nr:hypothetical protein DPMN_172556 [Dreissena polymorpha]
MPSLRSQSWWGTRLLVDFELLEVCNEAAFVQYSAILQAVCLKSEIYIADINDVYVLVTTDLHMMPVGEHPESHIVCNRCFLVEWLVMYDIVALMAEANGLSTAVCILEELPDRHVTIIA